MAKTMTNPFPTIEPAPSRIVQAAEAITAQAALTWADARFAFLCAMSGALPGEY